MILTGENFDALVQMYAHTGFLGGYELREGLPAVTLTVARSRGGVQVEGEPALSAVQGLDYDYLFSEDTLWRLQRPAAPASCLRCRRWAARACFLQTQMPLPFAAMCCRSWAAG